MFHTKVVEKIKTHILCSMNLFVQKRVCYEIMWKKKKIQSDRLQMAVMQLILFACGITKAKDTHYFSMATMVTRTRLNIALYVHCLSCYGIRYFLLNLCELVSVSPHDTSDTSAHNAILFLNSIQCCDYLHT